MLAQFWSDMEKVASMQALLADNFWEHCGHFWINNNSFYLLRILSSTCRGLLCIDTTQTSSRRMVTLAMLGTEWGTQTRHRISTLKIKVKYWIIPLFRLEIFSYLAFFMDLHKQDLRQIWQMNDQVVFFPVNLWTLFTGNGLSHMKGPVSSFVGCIPLPSLDSIITRNP